jgi:hypothetical protein
MKKDKTKSSKKSRFLKGLEKSIEDMKKHQKGEITLRNAFDLINEL